MSLPMRFDALCLLPSPRRVAGRFEMLAERTSGRAATSMTSSDSTGNAEHSKRSIHAGWDSPAVLKWFDLALKATHPHQYYSARDGNCGESISNRSQSRKTSTVRLRCAEKNASSYSLLFSSSHNVITGLVAAVTD